MFQLMKSHSNKHRNFWSYSKFPNYFTNAILVAPCFSIKSEMSFTGLRLNNIHCKPPEAQAAITNITMYVNEKMLAKIDK